MLNCKMKNGANQRLGQMDLQAQVGQDAQLFRKNGTRLLHAMHSCGEVRHIKPVCPKYDKTNSKTGGNSPLFTNCIVKD